MGVDMGDYVATMELKWVMGDSPITIKGEVVSFIRLKVLKQKWVLGEKVKWVDVPFEDYN